jgi:uncharacterized membrane protein
MRIAIASLLCFIVIAVGNAVSHGLGGAIVAVATDSVAPTNGSPFLFLVIAWLFLTLGTVYMVARERTPTLARAAIAGALSGLLVDGSWNIINKAMWSQWPLWFIGVDVAWHIVHGAVAGALVFFVLMRSKKRDSVKRDP